MVKYLGVRVIIDKKEQKLVAREQIDKNIKLMRWRLGKGRLGRYPVAHVLSSQIHAYLLRNTHGRSRCLETAGH